MGASAHQIYIGVIMEPIAPTATIELPAEPYGIAHFWAQGDVVSHSVALILLLMSILSWTQIAIKSWRTAKRKRAAQAVENFWQATTLEEATQNLAASGSHGADGRRECATIGRGARAARRQHAVGGGGAGRVGQSGGRREAWRTRHACTGGAATHRE